ncbi:helix-turn-helix domain-containing protein [Paraliobacillus salinarum]|uniref:helix-turn-helix domain-containing protein n=1 Tax=Paraliobacillus salinarum TaxID=1158996 RepID=UPI0015F424F6|nr:AraC family transcriptional regulator [Paraliobacillus salinarum]
MTTTRYSISESNKEEQFSLLYASKLTYSAEWASLIHTHPFTEIFYIIRGSGSITTHKNTFEVSKGSVFIVNPNVAHMESSSTKDPLECIVIGMEGLNLTNLSDDGKSFSIHKLSNQQTDVKFYFQTIYQEAQGQSDHYESMCHYLLGALIMLLKRQLTLEIEAEKQTSLSKEIAQAKQYIDQYFKEDISLNKLSQLTHLNKFYLSHAFKDALGQTPIDYVNHRRIEEAKVLLLTTDYMISQIATIVGYSSQTYFSEVFKKYELQSPTKYRKKQAIKNPKV